MCKGNSRCRKLTDVNHNRAKKPCQAEFVRRHIPAVSSGSLKREKINDLAGIPEEGRSFIKTFICLGKERSGMLDRQLLFFVYSTLPKTTVRHFLFEAGNSTAAEKCETVSRATTAFHQLEVTHEL